MVLNRVVSLCAVGVFVAAMTASCSSDSKEGAQDDGGTAALADYCEVARELNQAEIATPDMLTRARDLAPAQIADDVDFAAGALLEAEEGNPASFIAIFAQDEVTEAAARIDAFGAEQCGLEIDEPPTGDTGVEAGSTAVDVGASEYAFDVPEIQAGRVTLVLTNNGNEAHFLGVARLLGDASVEDAMSSEDPDAEGLTETIGDSGLAAPGGDQEFLVADLEPGRYAFFCFLPSAEGTPHAFLGMAQEVTVS